MKTGKLFWGFVAIGAAVLILLRIFGIGEEYEIFRLVGSLLLLAVAVASIAKFHFFLFFIPLALVVYLWRVPLGIASTSVWLLLAAAVLLGVGLGLLLHKKPHVHIEGHHHEKFAETSEVLNDDEIVNIDSSLGEHIKYIHADNLRRVNIKSNLASTKVYFDECKVGSEGCIINIDVNFSELVLNVPRTWVLENKVNVFAGAVTNLQPAKSGELPTAQVTGSLNFGELKINYN